MLYAHSFALWQVTKARPRAEPAETKTSWPAVLCIGLAIVFLHWPVLRWTVDKFLHSSAHWHWYIALGAVLFAMRGNSRRISLSDNYLATVLLVCCVAIEMLNRYTLHIQLLSAVLFIVTLHAVSGYLIRNDEWRGLKWPVVIGVALLPLDFYLEPYFGYPLRLATAKVAGELLSLSGFNAVSSESILLVENTASVVDLDCSGINSLWAGSVFYLLLSWLMQLSVNIRWWCLWLLLIFLLLLSNVVRIYCLVVLDVSDMHRLAEIAHTSMSALGFTLAILIVWHLAGTQDRRVRTTSAPVCNERALSFTWPCLPLVILLLGVSLTPSSNVQPALNISAIELPAELDARSIALRDQETRFFSVSGAIATKYQLGVQDHNNTVVLVTSNWWKAQHKPDHCLQAMGFSIQKAEVLTLNGDNGRLKAVTVLNLIDVDEQPYTAVYWFQAEGKFTPDHYRRMADTFSQPNRQWTMASLLLEGDADFNRIEELVLPIAQSIHVSYGEML